MNISKVIDRLDQKSMPEPNSGCWLWLGSLKRQDSPYGQLSIDGKTYLAHRLSYQAYIGEIPNGLMVCHRCDNPSCINPQHLFLGTAHDNNQDCAKKGRNLFGPKNKLAKFTMEQARAIRSSTLPVAEISKKFGTTTQNVYRIRNNQRYVERQSHDH